MCRAIRLLWGTRVYLQAVMDNYSRKILAWSVSETKTEERTRQLLVEAQRHLAGDQPKPNVVVDDGSENYGDANRIFEDGGSLGRLLAQVDIVESNSMIESWWSQLKHMWLFLHPLETIESVRKLVAFYVAEHNEVMPRLMLGGRTPDEVYLGLNENVSTQLATQRQKARADRIKHNRAQRCDQCSPDETKNPSSFQGSRYTEQRSP
jgi:putative transposase